MMLATFVCEIYFLRFSVYVLHRYTTKTTNHLFSPDFYLLSFFTLVSTHPEYDRIMFVHA